MFEVNHQSVEVLGLLVVVKLYLVAGDGGLRARVDGEREVLRIEELLGHNFLSALDRE